MNREGDQREQHERGVGPDPGDLRPRGRECGCGARLPARRAAPPRARRPARADARRHAAGRLRRQLRPRLPPRGRLARLRGRVPAAAGARAARRGAQAARRAAQVGRGRVPQRPAARPHPLAARQAVRRRGRATRARRRRAGRLRCCVLYIGAQHIADEFVLLFTRNVFHIYFMLSNLLVFFSV